jgi:glycosyltransferase involved in cell wall biosynthesis
MLLKRPGDDLERPHNITVCICTYKRAVLLNQLLKALCKQKTDGLFLYSIVVVDNDQAETAKQVVAGMREECPVKISYYCEPVQNISLTRNKTVEKSTGDLIAFIDDDQFPEEDWLLNLYKAYKEFRTDAVLGPIRPHFPVQPPKWIIKGKIFDRKSFPTGVIMKIKDTRHMRTGNVLIRRSMIEENEAVFDPAFGIIGGEDQDFFRRKIVRGYTFVWCDEAIINETFPADRFKRTYFLRRALRRGATQTKLGKMTILSLLKSLAAVVLYTSVLPIFLVTSHHRFMKFLIKDCDHIGNLLAACGVVLVKAWPIQTSQNNMSS